MECLDKIDFYEIVLNDKVLCDIGVTGDTPEITQKEATRIAHLINESATAEYDRFGEVWA